MRAIRPGHVGFVVDTIAREQVSVQGLLLSPVSIIQRMLHTHLNRNNTKSEGQAGEA